MTPERRLVASARKLDIKAHIHPDVSIEVDDVDEVYERARAAGAEVVYALTDEEWGLRRFFVRDPNGAASSAETVATALKLEGRLRAQSGDGSCCVGHGLRGTLAEGTEGVRVDLRAPLRLGPQVSPSTCRTRSR